MNWREALGSKIPMRFPNVSRKATDPEAQATTDMGFAGY